ncbi:MAG: hybrid sensor histidine kinase/response regulator, partial [Chryseobacterium sp.]|nr:hybrid sensor histidine kinase/response regulator [Chryseobacterium sp.]
PNDDKIQITKKLTDKNQVLFCVKDYGIGIPQDKQDRIFEQYYRVSGSMEHTFPGLGLGLYISSEIIKRSGGRIFVNSVEDKGSDFCFEIPKTDNP